MAGRYEFVGTLLFIVLIVLVLAVLLGAGGYGIRRYWSPAGAEVYEGGDVGAGAGAGIIAAVLAMLFLVLLFFGFTQWNWFGTNTGAQENNPASSTPPASALPSASQ